MAEKNNYYGSGIFVAGNIDIGAIGKPADSRVMVPNPDGLAELVADKRVYDGMIVYCESTKTYHKCSVEWDSSMNITSSSWKQVEIQSLEELKALIASESTAAMEFKGTIKNGTLPTLEQGVNYDGNLYKIATNNVTIPAALNAEGGEEDVVAKPGDSIVCEGGKWYHIPSGDDIEDTWRAIKVNGVEKFSNGTTSSAVDFAQGDNVTITEAAGVITIAAADTHYESKLVAANSATDAADETAEDGQVHLNLIENGEVKSSHKIVGGGGISVTHTVAEGEDGVNVITIEAAEGAKYDLAAKIETTGGNKDKAYLSLTGTDNSEDKVYVVGDDAIAVTVEGGKIKVSAHDTKYTGSEGNGVKVTVVDDGAISAEIEANAVTTEKIADKNVTLAKLEDSIQTKLGYIDTGKNVSEAIGDAIDTLKLADTYVEEEGFEDRVKGIKVASAESADNASEATHAVNADNATNAANAQEAVHATNADEATHATNADNATNAANATNAQEAAHAVNADEATHATNADEATHAGSADAATHATSAGKVDTALTVKVGGVDVVFDGSEAKTADVDSALAFKADKSVVDAMYTNAQIDGFITEVKNYADDNDANTTYAISYESKVDGEDGHPARIVLTPSEGEATYVDATPFIKDGMLDNVSYNENTNTLTFTFNTDAGKENVDVELTDILAPYTGSNGDRITVSISDGVISADLIYGRINVDYLDSGVCDSLALANTALQAKDISHLATSGEVDGKLADVEGRFDSEIEELESALATTNEAIEAAKTEAANQATVVLGEAQKYADDKVAALAGDGNTTTVKAVADRVKDLEDANHISEVEADTGLKIIAGTKGANNKVTIDENIVFVLDCNW